MRTQRQIVSLERARKIKALRCAQRVSSPHPRDFLSAEMSARGWTVHELAGHMNGDRLRNSAILVHYFDHPTGDIQLGFPIAHRIADALGLSAELILALEGAWLEHRRAA